MKQTNPAKTRSAAGKRPYRSPKLREYGDIRAVTKALSLVGMGDGAMSGVSKSIKL